MTLIKPFLIVLVTLLFSYSTNAQLWYSQQDADINLEPNVEHFGYIYIVNTYGVDIQWNWRALENGFNNDWQIQFCECATCYTNDFDPLPAQGSCPDFGAGDTIEWKVGINPLNEPITPTTFVVVVNDQTHETSDTLTWTTSTTSSLEDIDSDNAVRFYPNPANESIQIAKTTGSFANDAIVRISDLSGREIKAISLRSGSSVESVSTIDLTEGLYFFMVYDGQSLTSIQKVTVVH
ncbi:MAG TPA: hypothetical protein DDX92_06785 [Flavobacteriales bacterium]|jgi:hypothetical protein|nr:hypothetical protein [Flavobacteriales bacterium]